MSGPDYQPNRPADGADILRAEFDWDAVPPSMAVVETVAIAADRQAVALPPLIETLDPDALDRLFDDSRLDSDLSLSFHLSDYAVTVTGDGVVRVVGALP